jgi:hypothetical protein
MFLVNLFFILILGMKILMLNPPYDDHEQHLGYWLLFIGVFILGIKLEIKLNFNSRYKVRNKLFHPSHWPKYISIMVFGVVIVVYSIPVANTLENHIDKIGDDFFLALGESLTGSENVQNSESRVRERDEITQDSKWYLILFFAIICSFSSYIFLSITLKYSVLSGMLSLFSIFFIWMTTGNFNLVVFFETMWFFISTFDSDFIVYFISAINLASIIYRLYEVK